MLHTDSNTQHVLVRDVFQLHYRMYDIQLAVNYAESV